MLEMTVLEFLVHILDSMRFRVPAVDQSDCSICYNYDINQTGVRLEPASIWTHGLIKQYI